MTSVPASSRLEPKPMFDWFFGFAVLCVVGLYVRAIFFTPIEIMQGLAQKIYYIHVPAFLAVYIGVGVMALMSVVYLWLHDERADRLAAAAAEVSLVFLVVGLSMGTLWAKRIWGTYWVWWDLRLTLTLFLGLIIAAYVVLRDAIEDDGMRARYCAVLSILSALLIPFIHLSVYMVKAHLHPDPILLQPSAPKMSNEMLITFLSAFVAFAILAIALIRARYRLSVLREIALRLEEGTV